MANLTITVDEASLKEARIRALKEGTSVNALLSEFLTSYAGVHRKQQDAVSRILAAARRSNSRRGNIKWSRDELHERH